MRTQYRIYKIMSYLVPRVAPGVDLRYPLLGLYPLGYVYLAVRLVVLFLYLKLAFVRHWRQRMRLVYHV